MKIKKFLNIDVEQAPLEMKLDVEMRCREIMASDEINMCYFPNIAKMLVLDKNLNFYG